MRRLLTPVLLALASVCAAQDASVLRVATSTAWAPPFGEAQEGGASPGFNAELALALGQQLKRKVQFVRQPHARLELSGPAGEFDLRCQVSPEAVRQPQQYDWSPVLLNIPELLVGARGSAPLQKLAELAPDASVGAVTHVRYAQLESQFGTSGWRREEATEAETMLKKFSLGRSRYALTNAYEWAWYRRSRTDHGGADWRLSLGFAPYQCAVPRSAHVKAAEILSALQHLRESGQIDRLMLKHGIPTVVVVAAAASPLPTLNRTQLDALYLGRQRSLEDGSVPQLLMLGDASLSAFAEQVLQHDLAQLRGEWSRATFSGNGKKPRQLDSPASLKNWLRKEPLALGFLPSAELDNSLKLVLFQP